MPLLERDARQEKGEHERRTIRTDCQKPLTDPHRIHPPWFYLTSSSSFLMNTHLYAWTNRFGVTLRATKRMPIPTLSPPFSWRFTPWTSFYGYVFLPFRLPRLFYASAHSVLFRAMIFPWMIEERLQSSCRSWRMKWRVLSRLKFRVFYGIAPWCRRVLRVMRLV